MCGVAGFFSTSPVLNREALAGVVGGMAALLRHRGPDSGGVWCAPEAGLGLGFRRLAILDLEPTGEQPMRSADGRFTLVFNGEIYNFPTLRRDLEGLGHRFHGRSDTEVLLASISQWGVAEALRRQHGMFAGAVWDGGEQALYLFRDRLGIKPLYYGRLGQAFVFASELKAFAACPGFDAGVDGQALAQYLQFGYVSSPFCIYKGFQKLPAGHWLRLQRAGLESTPQPFWSLREALAPAGMAGAARGRDELVEETERLLQAAVGRHMVADVPVGAFLSGGIDSSLITALMQSQSRRPVRTFTIGFGGSEFDESGHAEAIARHLGTDHTALQVSSADVLEAIPSMAAIYDEPFADSSQVPTWLIARLARQSVAVALSGDGGDELFGGYNRYRFAPRFWRMLQPLPPQLRRAGGRLLAGLSASARQRLVQGLGCLLHGRVARAGLTDKMAKLTWALESDSMDHFYDRLCRLGTVGPRLMGAGPLSPVQPSGCVCELADASERMMYRDLLTYLPDDILTKLDRATMAVSLEARVPLLDDAVVAWAAPLPATLKMQGRETKWLLRRVLARYVPVSLFERPKAGFAMPVAAWLRGPLRPWAETLIQDACGLLDQRAVQQLWRQFLAGDGAGHQEVWAVLMLRAWRALAPPTSTRHLATTVTL